MRKAGRTIDRSQNPISSDLRIQWIIFENLFWNIRLEVVPTIRKKTYDKIHTNSAQDVASMHRLQLHAFQQAHITCHIPPVIATTTRQRFSLFPKCQH